MPSTVWLECRVANQQNRTLDGRYPAATAPASHELIHSPALDLAASWNSLFNRFHKPFRNVRRIEDDPTGVFGKFVDLNQQHAGSVFFQHVFELVDQVVLVQYALDIHIAR